MPNSTIRNSFFIFMGPNKTGKIACHGGCVDKNVVMFRGSISFTVGSAAFQAKKKAEIPCVEVLEQVNIFCVGITNPETSCKV